LTNWGKKEKSAIYVDEVVYDPDYKLGRVSYVTNVLGSKRIWIEDEFGNEIYENQEHKHFFKAPYEETNNFHIRRLAHKGYHVGTICAYRGDVNVPLEIIQMKWENMRRKMLYILYDLRKFEHTPLRSESETRLILPNLNLPDHDGIFTTINSGLKYRIDLQLLEVRDSDFINSGSIWEYSTQEDALRDIENIKARQKIRRVASVINADWKVSFPCWTIEIQQKDNDYQYRVIKVNTLSGYAGYFKTAYHAAYAMKILTPEDWIKSLSNSQDSLSY